MIELSTNVTQSQILNSGRKTEREGGGEKKRERELIHSLSVKRVIISQGEENEIFKKYF